MYYFRRFMMKRTLISVTAAALAVTSVLAIAGCGKNEQSSADTAATTAAAQETTAAQAQGVIPESDTVFTYNGAKVELNTPIDDMLATLGQANEVSSQLSCHGEGEDKTYSYNGFTVNSYPLNGKDYVMEVVVNEAGIPTSKGVAVGDPVSKVTEAYGNNYKAVGVYYSYDAGNKKSLQFLIENDTVTEIDYFYTV